MIHRLTRSRREHDPPPYHRRDGCRHYQREDVVFCCPRVHGTYSNRGICIKGYSGDRDDERASHGAHNMIHRLPLTCALTFHRAHPSCPIQAYRQHLVQSARTTLSATSRGDQSSRTGDSSRAQMRSNQLVPRACEGAVITPRTNHAALCCSTRVHVCTTSSLQHPDNYLLAHELAKSAFEAGTPDARYLVPQTIDRYRA